MPLSDALKRTLHEADASSFRLAGEELWLVTGADLRRAAYEWTQRLEQIAPSLRDELEREHAELARDAYRWLYEYNDSLEARLRGYAAIGRAFRWEFPWPVVAILGVQQVRGGVRQSEALHLAGSAASALLEVGDWMQDVLRRTNRGIFADSIPTALWALRAHALNQDGRKELAAALLDGPLPPAMDDESRSLARGLFDALCVPDGPKRFDALVAATVRQFEREQAVFTAQMGARRALEGPVWSAIKTRFTRMNKVAAPVIENGRLKTRPYVFPAGFDVRDHRQRSDHFARAFVHAVTRSVNDYRVAVEAVGGAAPRF